MWLKAGGDRWRQIGLSVREYGLLRLEDIYKFLKKGGLKGDLVLERKDDFVFEMIRIFLKGRDMRGVKLPIYRM